MTEQSQMESYLASHPCPYCGEKEMRLTGTVHHSLWDWRCSQCCRNGNVGYNLHELLRIELSPEKEVEFKRGVENVREFIDKWGIPQPKTQIKLNQDPGQY